MDHLFYTFGQVASAAIVGFYMVILAHVAWTLLKVAAFSLGIVIGLVFRSLNCLIDSYLFRPMRSNEELDAMDATS